MSDRRILERALDSCFRAARESRIGVDDQHHLGLAFLQTVERQITGFRVPKIATGAQQHYSLVHLRHKGDSLVGRVIVCHTD